MCDFYDFGLTFFSINVFFVLLKMSKSVFWVVARLPQRLKSTFFDIFSNGAAPKGPAERRKKCQKTMNLALEVIVQPPKTHFLTFSKVQKKKKK